MEVIKNVVAVLAGLIGLLTALLTLYAKYLDVKKSSARESADSSSTADDSISPPPSPNLSPVEAPAQPVGSGFPPTQNSAAAIIRSRAAVKAPAITLLIAGLLSMFFNLVVAGFGYVDQFVTPLTTESKAKRALMEAVQRNEIPPNALGKGGTQDGLSEDATAAITVFTMISLSVASASAAWAGYGMLRLRSYSLSVVGSFAIMAGGGLCCMAGIPIGIWSLSVLYKPEVAASFR